MIQEYQFSKGLQALQETPVVSRFVATGEDWEIAKFLELFHYAQSIEASDVHLKSGEVPRIRTVQGVLPPENPRFRQPLLGTCLEQLILYLERLTTAVEMNLIEQERSPVDVHGFHHFSVKIANSCMRVSAYRETSGYALAIRFFYNKYVSLDFIGIKELAQMVDFSHGLFLITGPTGMGKTTSMAAMVDYVNARESIHISTLEDPVEFIFTEKRSRITQRSVPSHVNSYADGLVSVMRQDADIIVFGELREKEHMRAALQAAESGHLVLSTMHAASVTHAVQRFITTFSGQEQIDIRGLLSNTLIGVSNQSLLPGLQRKRVLGFELLVNNVASAKCIREGNLSGFEEILSKDKGMLSWHARLDQLLLTAQISPETWKKWLRDPKHANPLERNPAASVFANSFGG